MAGDCVSDGCCYVSSDSVWCEIADDVGEWLVSVKCMGGGGLGDAAGSDYVGLEVWWWCCSVVGDVTYCSGCVDCAVSSDVCCAYCELVV